ncbi:MAG TPA: 30S ribosomal protein S6 [Candidatus Hydrogenedentes bacterium]|nr:30S ribosomal protein S6 [Candidatus Hydrogenedentota bacterium]HQH66972.1 30S ribosomal protein S6 [Candidatus Hydrogenedentota bacterium]HQM48609.1 30S ribosomal protein S6 [Candidatus Hydrogenedentota bacterium]
MRTYEALYIVHPEVKDDEIQTIAKNVEKLVTDNGGAVVRSEIQGKRKLAYEVRRCTEGCYVLLRFQAEPEFITRLEGYFRLTENIIRSLVVYFDEHTLRLEAEQERRKQAEVQTAHAARPFDDEDDDDRGRRRRPSRYRDEDDDEDEDDDRDRGRRRRPARSAASDDD